MGIDKSITSLLVLITVLWCIVGCAEDQQEFDPDTILEDAHELYLQGKHQEAIALLKVMVAETHRIFGSGAELAQAFHMVARLQGRCLLFAEADSTYFTVERLIAKHRLPDTLLARVHYEHGTIRLGLRDHDGAQDLYGRAMTIYAQRYDSCDHRVQEVRAGMASAYIIEGKFDKAVPLKETWLSCKTFEEIISDSVALSHAAQLVSVYLLLDRLSDAERLAHELMLHYDSLAAIHPYQYAELLLAMGNIRRRVGESRSALESYLKGFSLIENSSDSLSNVFRWYLRAFGRSYEDVGDIELARAYYERDLKLTRLQYGVDNYVYRRTAEGVATFYRGIGDSTRAREIEAEIGQ